MYCIKTFQHSNKITAACKVTYNNEKCIVIARPRHISIYNLHMLEIKKFYVFASVLQIIPLKNSFICFTNSNFLHVNKTLKKGNLNLNHQLQNIKSFTKSISTSNYFVLKTNNDKLIIGYKDGDEFSFDDRINDFTFMNVIDFAGDENKLYILYTEIDRTKKAQGKNSILGSFIIGYRFNGTGFSPFDSLKTNLLYKIFFFNYELLLIDENSTYVKIECNLNGDKRRKKDENSNLKKNSDTKIKNNEETISICNKNKFDFAIIEVVNKDEKSKDREKFFDKENSKNMENIPYRKFIREDTNKYKKICNLNNANIISHVKHDSGILLLCENREIIYLNENLEIFNYGFLSFYIDNLIFLQKNKFLGVSYNDQSVLIKLNSEDNNFKEKEFLYQKLCDKYKVDQNNRKTLQHYAEKSEKHIKFNIDEEFKNKKVSEKIFLPKITNTKKVFLHKNELHYVKGYNDNILVKKIYKIRDKGKLILKTDYKIDDFMYQNNYFYVFFMNYVHMYDLEKLKIKGEFDRDYFDPKNIFDDKKIICSSKYKNFEINYTRKKNIFYLILTENENIIKKQKTNLNISCVVIGKKIFISTFEDKFYEFNYDLEIINETNINTFNFGFYLLRNYFLFFTNNGSIFLYKDEFIKLKNMNCLIEKIVKIKKNKFFIKSDNNFILQLKKDIFEIVKVNSDYNKEKLNLELDQNLSSIKEEELNRESDQNILFIKEKNLNRKLDQNNLYVHEKELNHEFTLRQENEDYKLDQIIFNDPRKYKDQYDRFLIFSKLKNNKISNILIIKKKIYYSIAKQVYLAKKSLRPAVFTKKKFFDYSIKDVLFFENKKIFIMQNETSNKIKIIFYSNDKKTNKFYLKNSNYACSKIIDNSKFFICVNTDKKSKMFILHFKLKIKILLELSEEIKVSAFDVLDNIFAIAFDSKIILYRISENILIKLTEINDVSIVNNIVLLKKKNDFILIVNDYLLSCMIYSYDYELNEIKEENTINKKFNHYCKLNKNEIVFTTEKNEIIIYDHNLSEITKTFKLLENAISISIGSLIPKNNNESLYLCNDTGSIEIFCDLTNYLTKNEFEFLLEIQQEIIKNNVFLFNFSEKINVLYFDILKFEKIDTIISNFGINLNDYYEMIKKIDKIM
ncbi:hypothetical protein GVAV_000396 [Gurleya vavrai]